MSGNFRKAPRRGFWQPFVLVRVGVLLAFGLIIGRLWQLQVMQGHDYLRRSTENIIRQRDLPATRGQILARDGRVLADNRPAYSVRITPRNTTADALDRLALVTHLSTLELSQLKAQVATAHGMERLSPILLAGHVDRAVMAQLESDAIVLPGVQVDADPERIYPEGSALGHALGYMNQITADELADRKEAGYRTGELVGRAGIERQWEAFLRGKEGHELQVVDAKGQPKDDVPLSRLTNRPARVDAVPGANVVLTIDLELQKKVEALLAAHQSAAAVVVDVESGRILALGSQPSIDPNRLIARMSKTEMADLVDDPMRPLVDKSLHESYYPGSTFKIVPMLAALTDDLIDPSAQVQCKGSLKYGGREFHCAEIHGWVNLHEALARSCNVFFFQVGDKLGIDRMAQMANELGFGVPSGIGLGEAAGFVPTMAWYKTHGGYQGGYALNTAIGQGSVQTSPIQVAMAYAAIANGGKLFVPQIVSRIERPDGTLIQRFEPQVRRELAVDPDDLRRVRRALYDAVEERKGTAYAARVPGLQVAGKTGTAQVMHNYRGQRQEGDDENDHAWFASFAPFDKPQIAVVVLVEHGGFGAKAAAPTAMAIYEAYFHEVAALTGGSGARIKAAP